MEPDGVGRGVQLW